MTEEIVDVVQMYREIREERWNEIKDLSREEQKKVISERNSKANKDYEEFPKYYDEWKSRKEQR